MDKPKRGRPKTDEPRTHAVTTWLSAKEYAALVDDAKRTGKPLSAVLRDRPRRDFS